MHKYWPTESCFWSAVAQFVGNGRTRSQCSQRWIRVLDPRIYKQQWTAGEEDLLITLVAKYGQRSWMQVSAEIKTRSDVQCRYHYLQLHKYKRTRQPVPEEPAQAHARPGREAGARDPLVQDLQFDLGDGMQIPLTTSFSLDRSDSLFDSGVWTFTTRE
jgi:hypothetical protein